MDVTVAICTWNRSDSLRQTLEHLTRLAVPGGLQWEVLIVDNNCTDATPDVVRKFARQLPIRLVHEPKGGLSHARNRALAEAAGDLMLWTDDDVLVDPGWLETFVQAAKRHPDGVVFGGPREPLFVHEPDPDLANAFVFLQTGFCIGGYPGPDGVIDRYWPSYIIGMNMGMRRSACDGLVFDPGLGPSPRAVQPHGEETAFIVAMLKRGGCAVWSSGMRVRHCVTPSRMTLQYLTKFAFSDGQATVHREGVRGGRSYFGVPAWLLLRCAKARCRQWIWEIRGNRRESLLALKDYWYDRGVIRAYRAVGGATRSGWSDVPDTIN